MGSVDVKARNVYTTRPREDITALRTSWLAIRWFVFQGYLHQPRQEDRRNAQLVLHSRVQVPNRPERENEDAEISDDIEEPGGGHLGIATDAVPGRDARIPDPRLRDALEQHRPEDGEIERHIDPKKHLCHDVHGTAFRRRKGSLQLEQKRNLGGCGERTVDQFQGPALLYSSVRIIPNRHTIYAHLPWLS